MAVGDRATNAVRLARLIGLALLSACLLCSCSDQSSIEGRSAAESHGAGVESGYFVDEAALETLCVSSGMTYPIVTDERTITGANPAPADATLVKLYRAMFIEALGSYPKKFLDEIGLRSIVLGRRITVDGTACYSFSDVEHGRLFLNLDAGSPDGYVRRTLHHEIFHFVDFAEDGRLDEDRAWSALNPVGVLDGSGGGSMQNDSDAGRPDESLVGFVNRYATSGLAEDKAEVYASLVFDKAWMLRRSSADSILGRKVERIRTSLRRFGPLASGLLNQVQ
jgi:hypothetical protein